jgi:hypothetical protein
MKTCLLALLCLIAFGASSAFAQTYHTTTKKQPPQQVKPAPAVNQVKVGGVLPRALRGGNPLQLLNPRAPAKYGTSQEAIVFHPRDMGAPWEIEKWKGIKFFVFEF